MISLSTNLASEEITDESFTGKWCGKWDNMYSMCLSIKSVEKGAIAKHQWLEHKNGKFKKSDKKIERINRNTLKIENIWFALNQNDLTQATAMGIFPIWGRVAHLTKESAK